MNLSQRFKIQLHHDFWERKVQNQPLISTSLSGWFIKNQFSCLDRLLIKGQEILPEMIRPEDFIADYERQYRESLLIPQNTFWSGCPFTGIPWMEAFMGCKVYAMEESFISQPSNPSLEELVEFKLDPENPWYKLYWVFMGKLVELSAGRFPINKSLLRGPTDVLGALIGQTEMIYALYDNPDKIKKVISSITSVFKTIMAEQYKRIPSFLGGYSMTIFNIWAPGKVTLYQDDAAAILSPVLYSDFFAKAGEDICDGYDYTAIHVHPTAFHTIDDLLGNEKLKVIEINKDEGGPSVEEMLPILKKVNNKKNLILWGEFSKKDLVLLKRELNPVGVAYSLLVKSKEEAEELYNVLCS